MSEESSTGSPRRKWLRWIVIFCAISSASKIGSKLLNAAFEPEVKPPSVSASPSDATIGIAFGRVAAKTVESYFAKHKEFPSSLTAAQFDAPLPDPVESIRVNPETGALKIVLMGWAPSPTRTFFLNPTIEATGMTWECRAGEVPVQNRPPECPDAW
ncbi:hypothetical protein [Variovorax sp. SG517]|uniref:hypothetical protein n=1 Tax=Variovorax sp. SG517 TaxID=2587117 RepID=UPI00159E607D|nr:hypothetical protein [Variovorax sp. SG517]